MDKVEIINLNDDNNDDTSPISPKFNINKLDDKIFTPEQIKIEAKDICNKETNLANSSTNFESTHTALKSQATNPLNFQAKSPKLIEESSHTKSQTSGGIDFANHKDTDNKPYLSNGGGPSQVVR